MTEFEHMAWLVERAQSLQQFAEAKNAIVATIAIASLAISPAIEDHSTLQTILLYLSQAGFYISAFVALYTFWPKYRRSMVRNSNDANPIYFEDVASLSADELVARCRLATLEHQWERLYVEQAVVNSKIAASKMRVFKIAVALYLVCLFLHVLAILQPWNYLL